MSNIFAADFNNIEFDRKVKIQNQGKSKEY